MNTRQCRKLAHHLEVLTQHKAERCGDIVTQAKARVARAERKAREAKRWKYQQAYDRAATNAYHRFIQISDRCSEAFSRHAHVQMIYRDRCR